MNQGKPLWQVFQDEERTNRMLDERLKALNALLTRIDETNSTVEAEVAAQEQRVAAEQAKLDSLNSLVRMLAAPEPSDPKETKERKKRKYVRKPKGQINVTGCPVTQTAAVQTPAEA